MCKSSKHKLKTDNKSPIKSLAMSFDEQALDTNSPTRPLEPKATVLAVTTCDDNAAGIIQNQSPIPVVSCITAKQGVAESFNHVTEVLETIRQNLLCCKCSANMDSANANVCCQHSFALNLTEELQDYVGELRAYCVQLENKLKLLTESMCPEPSPGKSKIPTNRPNFEPPQDESNLLGKTHADLTGTPNLSSHTQNVYDGPNTVKDLAFMAQQQRDIDEINDLINKLELPPVDFAKLGSKQLEQLRLMCHECCESLNDEQATLDALNQLTTKLVEFIQKLALSSNSTAHADAQKFLANREKLQGLKALVSKLGRYERLYCSFAKTVSHTTSKPKLNLGKPRQKVAVRQLNHGTLYFGSAQHFEGNSLHVQGTWFINTDYLMYLLATSISGLELKVQTDVKKHLGLEHLETSYAPKLLTSAVTVKMSIPLENSNQEYGAFSSLLQVPLDALPITPTSSMPLGFAILMLESFRAGILPYTWRQILCSWGRDGHACLEYGHSNYARALEVLVETIFRPMDLAATQYLLYEEAKCQLCMDETVTRVLSRPGTDSLKRQYSLIVVIEFHDAELDQLSYIIKIVDLNGRSADKIQNALKANNVLELFENKQVTCVMSDCYAGYTFVEAKAPRAACFAHCVRRFRLACDSIHAKIKRWVKSGLSNEQIFEKYGQNILHKEQVMIRVSKLFDSISAIEHKCHAEAEALLKEVGIDKNQHPAQYLASLYKIRAEHRQISLKCLDSIEEQCSEFVGDSIVVSPKTGTAKVSATADKDLINSAVCYFLNAKAHLRNALLEVRCDLTNNYCERIAKAVTLPFKQRKMCFQTVSQLHNHLSAQSFWETCLANKRNPDEVLTWLHYIVSMTQYGLYLRDRVCAGIDISKHAQNAVQFRNEAVSKLDYLGMFKRIISGRPLTKEIADDFIARVVTKPLTKDDGTSTSKAKAEL